MFRLLLILLLLKISPSFSNPKFIKPIDIKISLSGLHVKKKSRHISFGKNKKVFEIKGRNEVELLWGVFSVFYFDVLESKLFEVKDGLFSKVKKTCNEVITFNVSNGKNFKNFEICESPKQNGKIPGKVLKWARYLIK